ncbi:ABC transporter ATP-binding protein [Natrarchaeobius chitinivorans]|uniref:ABC-type D-xylose/L-arabinose transporter n=1 Tax=Natrarchaeobius chitinivorans TaxID=1679083 RepID=A0A3N6MHK9_NATCH|nr:ABC transporter ATP-binding protein [Natrarchaeobius chitinivorans]RQG93526.1 ABC transporter ATP-binding protein [Natrarchaeobius chitinivorans]
MASVECIDLRRVFELSDGGEEVAVNSIDVTIEEGEFATVVGPSGCGKTTFLRMIAGLETPTSGDILFDGEDVTDVSSQNRGISMVFQSIALFPFKTVEDNIRYGLKYADAEGEEVDSRVSEMAEMVGITELLNKKPPQLSGGQQQRAALARALIRDPEVFLLDEPLSDLDAKLKSKMRTELKELHQMLPKTTIYVTHDQVEAMTLSDSVIVMNDGEIMQKSPPDEIYDHPQNAFVARFIGSPTINMIKGTVEDGVITADLFNRPLPVTAELQETVDREVENNEVLVGVRPNEVNKVSDGEDSIITGSVRIYEQMGDENIVYVESSDEEIRVSIPPNDIPEPDDQFDLTFTHEDVHLFDASTEEVITNELTRP